MYTQEKHTFTCFIYKDFWSVLNGRNENWKQKITFFYYEKTNEGNDKISWQFF